MGFTWSRFDGRLFVQKLMVQVYATRNTTTWGLAPFAIMPGIQAFETTFFALCPFPTFPKRSRPKLPAIVDKMILSTAVET